MTFRVSIRNLEPWKKQIREGSLEIPKECERNALVLGGILSEYAPKVVPSVMNLVDSEIDLIARSVAYLMRPDLLREGYSGTFNLIAEGEAVLPSRETMVFLNNPANLHEGWQPPWIGKRSNEAYRDVRERELLNSIDVMAGHFSNFQK